MCEEMFLLKVVRLRKEIFWFIQIIYEFLDKNSFRYFCAMTLKSIFDFRFNEVSILQGAGLVFSKTRQVLAIFEPFRQIIMLTNVVTTGLNRKL